MPAITIEFGLDPPTAGIPSTTCPTGLPVLVFENTCGFNGLLTCTAQTENDSGAFTGPSPLTWIESFSNPFSASGVLYAKAGLSIDVFFQTPFSFRLI